MATISNNPKFREQWSKFMHYFFDYLPTKYEATPREWDIRKLVWDFKDGKRSLQVAEMVARKIRMQFGATTGDIVFCCIPASTPEKNAMRYKDFSAEVCRLAGTINGYNHVGIEGTRLAVHEKKNGKSVESVQVIRFDRAFFDHKKVLVFDDVLTKGFSYARFACALESFGASVLGGYFLGRTLLK
jgi:predicted amidophosphoribosyltransferase